jgi:hypothetical protein
LYRYPDDLVRFYLDENRKPKVEEVTDDATLQFLTKYTKRYSFLPIEESAVLFLELSDDGETNPEVYCPTYVPLSNRDADTVTTTIRKSEGTYYLVDPPKLEDLITMAQFDAKHSEDSVYKGMDDEESYCYYSF